LLGQDRPNPIFLNRSDMARIGNTKAIAGPYGDFMFPERDGLCERKEFHERDRILRRKITDLQSGCMRVAFPLEGVCQDGAIVP
jgi:hypothetical protein